MVCMGVSNYHHHGRQNTGQFRYFLMNLMKYGTPFNFYPSINSMLLDCRLNQITSYTLEKIGKILLESM